MSTNPAVAKGISMDGGTAVADVLSEQGDTFTFKTRTKKRRPRLFLGGPHFLFVTFPTGIFPVYMQVAAHCS